MNDIEFQLIDRVGASDGENGLRLQVHLDHRHMGLGGDDSWSPCVHEQYLLPPTRYAFSMRLCPLLPSSSCYDIYRSQLPS
jgi:beta-galactosidase